MESSPTRDRPRVPCTGRRIPGHWTTREAQSLSSEEESRKCGYLSLKQCSREGIVARGRVVPEREYPLGPACLVRAESSSRGLWSVTLPRSELQPWQCLRCQSEQRGSEWQVCFKDVATTPREEKQEELVVKKTDPKPYYLASNPGSAVYLLCQFRQMA